MGMFYCGDFHVFCKNYQNIENHPNTLKDTENHRNMTKQNIRKITKAQPKIKFSKITGTQREITEISDKQRNTTEAT